MKNAKDLFLERVQYLYGTLTSPPTSDILTSKSPLTSDHNKRASMLRSGLAISAFVILEDYLKNRIGEIIENIKSSSISFSSIHEELRVATTLEALAGLNYRATNLKKNGDDWITFVQNETTRIASSRKKRYKLSKYSLGWNKPNVEADDICRWLKIFRVTGGWATIEKITSKAGVALIAPDVFYRKVSSRRHEAAHKPDADSLLTDLIQFTKDAKALALAYDVLLSKSLSEINRGNKALITGSKKLDDNDIKFRFIIQEHRYWKEYNDTNKRAIKKCLQKDQAIRAAKKRRDNNDFILIKDDKNSIVDWIAAKNKY